MDSIPLNTKLLERLGLVRADQWTTIRRYARRIGKGTPLVASIWIDAMLQLGYLTPYQAKRLQEGDAESLQVGSYVILQRRESLGWADCFDAYRLDDRRFVYLAVLHGVSVEAWEPLSEQLVQLSIEKKIPGIFFCIDEVGVDDRAGVWVTTSPCQGDSAASWMVQHGRFAPAVVLEVARQMAQALSQLESSQQVHGDLRAATLLLYPAEGAKLLLPGVRAVVRPRESFAETVGPIDLYDGLSPERAAEGAMPDVKSDLFAAGALWWQMLAGRSATLGGDGMGKLRAASRRKIDDIRKHAADVPEPLAQAITACTAFLREDRPNSFREVVAMLGEPSSQGVRALRRAMRGHPKTSLPTASTGGVSWQARYLGRAIVAAGIFVAVVALGLAADRFFNPPQQQVVVLSKPDKITTPPKVEPSHPTTEHPPEKVEPPQREVSAGSGSSSKDRSTEPLLDSVAIKPSGEADDGETNVVETIVLDAEEAVAAETLAARLQAGVKVIGPANGRAKVVVRDIALEIKVARVQFENLDFVAASSEETPSDVTPPAMIELRSSSVTFRGCTFHDDTGQGAPPKTVVHWLFPDARLVADPAELQTTLHNGRVVFENCIFGNKTGTVLHAEVHAAVAMELRNVLHLGGGPMLFLETPPKPDEPWRIQAEHVTLRESGPFWACRYRVTRSGRVRIEVNDSVFAPKGTQPLLLFVGENDPESIFRQIDWTGRGTLVKETTPTAIWQDLLGNRESMSDVEASIEGLSRSPIEFVAPADNTPGSSILESGTAPITTDTQPGIEVKGF